MLLAALAAGTGWWFGSGPGSLVAVPDVSGGTFAAAQERLAQDSLIAVQREENSLDIAAGTVIRTDPPSGTRVDRDAEVLVIVSLGPAEVQIPRFIDSTETDARTGLDSLEIRVDAENATFFTDQSPGTVVGVMVTPADGSEPFPCGDGCAAHQGDAAQLWISLGPAPDVVGDSEGAARSTLEGVNLVVAEETETETSETIEEGRVIRVVGPDRWWQPGDAVTLVVSTGPPLFEVPQVVGDTRDVAIQKLEEAGFGVDFAPFFGVVPNDITEVTASDPAAGEMRVRGTRVYIQLTVTG